MTEPPVGNAGRTLPGLFQRCIAQTPTQAAERPSGSEINEVPEKESKLEPTHYASERSKPFPLSHRRECYEYFEDSLGNSLQAEHFSSRRT
jgi:hypothetical protein